MDVSLIFIAWKDKSTMIYLHYTANTKLFGSISKDSKLTQC